MDFNSNTIDKFWGKERRYIEEDYTTIPFQEVKLPSYQFKCSWAKEDLIGYISTWSVVHTMKLLTLSHRWYCLLRK